jgi:hypothetical protein
VSLVGRVLVKALVIGCVQWLVLSYSGNKTLVGVALGLPALITAYTLPKALMVIEIDPTRGRAGSRR